MSKLHCLPYFTTSASEALTWELHALGMRFVINLTVPIDDDEIRPSAASVYIYIYIITIAMFAYSYITD